jgi:hypothetical protein
MKDNVPMTNLKMKSPQTPYSLTKREVALAKAIEALRKWSGGEITKSALLAEIGRLQAIKPAHKQL